MLFRSAIKKVKEFGLYHAIGDLPNSALTVKAFKMAVAALEEIHQYRAIGTVEEFREGRERQIPKKPMRIRLLETSGVHCGICPICKNPVYADLSNKNHREYCGHCGQAIDWSENNGE